MPRIRTLKPEAFQHRKVGRLSDRAFRLWVGMIVHADDAGRLVGDPAQLRVLIFGYQDGVRVQHVAKALEDVAAVGLVRRYDVAGVPYVDFPSWKDHQRIERPTPSKLPEYRHSENGHRILTESSPTTPEGSEGIKDQGSEGKGVERSSKALAVLSDGQFITALRANPAYTGIDLEREFAKMDAYLLTPKGRGRRKTRQFVVNWLNRIDRPLGVAPASDPGGQTRRPLGATAQTAGNPGVLARALEREQEKQRAGKD